MAVASRPKVVPVFSKRAAAPHRPAPRSVVPTPRPVVPQRPSRSQPPLRSQRPPQSQRPLGLIEPVTPQFPNWLILLMAIRKLSTPVLLFLVMGVLPLYAWRVNTQDAWGTHYSKLEQLQQDERTWLTRSEERKYEISENLENNPTGFVPKSSKTTLFLKPAPARPAQPAPPQPTQITQTDVAPVGY